MAARVAMVLAATVSAACEMVRDSGQDRLEESHVNELARRYVAVVLAIGQHDPDYLDPY